MCRFLNMVGLALILTTCSACTTVTKIYERDGQEALLIECGAAS